MGIRVNKSHDVIIRNCLFQNATDVAGSGSGYAVEFGGPAHGINRVGYKNDSRYNLMENCLVKGPFMRHGIILQYFTHNNVIRNNVMENTALDAIDFHGEDEYLNEVYGNKIINCKNEAGIGVGNSGSDHDSAGPKNYIHDNIITNCKFGIHVSLGSPDTIIEKNTITGCTVGKGRGIRVRCAPGTIIKNNIITNNKAEDFFGIVLEFDKGNKGIGSGDPENIQIIGNTITDNTKGIVILQGKNIILKENNVTNNAKGDIYDDRVKADEKKETTEKVETAKSNDIAIKEKDEPKTKKAEGDDGESEKPKKSKEKKAKEEKGLAILPSDDSYVDMSSPEDNFSTKQMFRVKYLKGQVGRIAYLKFQVENNKNIKEAIFKFYGMLTESNPDDLNITYKIFGGTNNNWTESTINWNNSSNHAPKEAEITDIGVSVFELGKVVVSEKKLKEYSVDVTNFVKSSKDGIITLMIADTGEVSANVNLYSKEAAEKRVPKLIIK